MQEDSREIDGLSAQLDKLVHHKEKSSVDGLNLHAFISTRFWQYRFSKLDLLRDLRHRRLGAGLAHHFPHTGRIQD